MSKAKIELVTGSTVSDISGLRNRLNTKESKTIHSEDESDGSNNAQEKDSLLIQKKKIEKKSITSKTKLNKNDALMFIAITIFSIFVRCYKISHPNQVVFDEVHFGKFAGQYMNRTYFFDLHPPLAKLMFTLAGKLTGYDGIFDFKSIGLNYDENNVHYVGMRMLSAILGALVAPASYILVRASGFGIVAGIFGSLVVCLENGLITQSRLILLDSIMIFFTAYSAMSYMVFRNVTDKPFTFSWWFWLLSTGFHMGCAISSKWIALFLVAFIGIATVYDLWEIIEDKDVSLQDYMNQFFAKALALIALPLAIYIISFIIHFQVLYKIKEPDSGFSKEFNISFEGAESTTTEKYIYYGSTVRVKHTNTNSGYLHSHKHNWQDEKSSKQQQVTIYGYPDGNNLFTITPAYNTTVEGLKHVKNGDIVRLKHKSTGSSLHSHNVKAPVSKSDSKFEVSGYGGADFDGDSNDDFRVEIVSGSSASPDSKKQLEAIYTKFRLIHVGLNCALYNSRQKLPKYAFEQTEVVCMRDCRPKMSTWHIEFVENDMEGAKSQIISYPKLTLWGKIMEYNKRMIETNNELIGDHPFASRPQKWPFLARGTAYWGGAGSVIYQLGNPAVWWLSSVSVIAFIVLVGVNHIYYKKTNTNLVEIDDANIFLLVVGYLLHYLPFFLIGRELFLHHYFAALWFSMMVFVCLVAKLVNNVSKNKVMVQLAVYSTLSLLIIHSYFTYFPITYGTQFTKKQCEKMKWRKNWDIDCSHAL
ncbi:hypothetical protein BB558_005812 [Smittium angustum]|nr:hypothetical protein BB558_005812 [Smittium angustum]